MTRKHFIALAETVSKMYLPRGLCTDDQSDRQALRAYIAGELADACQQANSRFDRQRFLRACGVE